MKNMEPDKFSRKGSEEWASRQKKKTERVTGLGSKTNKQADLTLPPDLLHIPPK